MALPSSGPISLQDINVELGRSPTAKLDFNDPDVRTLAGKPTGQISLSDLRGKSFSKATYEGSREVYIGSFDSVQDVCHVNGTTRNTYLLVMRGGTSNAQIWYVYSSGTTSPYVYRTMDSVNAVGMSNNDREDGFFVSRANVDDLIDFWPHSGASKQSHSFPDLGHNSFGIEYIGGRFASVGYTRVKMWKNAGGLNWTLDFEVDLGYEIGCICYGAGLLWVVSNSTNAGTRMVKGYNVDVYGRKITPTIHEFLIPEVTGTVTGMCFRGEASGNWYFTFCGNHKAKIYWYYYTP